MEAERCVTPGGWVVDGFTVIRDSTGRRWFMYGPNDEFGMARTLTSAREMIRRGLCDNCVESHGVHA